MEGDDELSFDQAHQRIIELSKKNRNINLLVERERTRNAQLQAQLEEGRRERADLEKELEAARRRADGSEGAQSLKDAEKKNKELTAKLTNLRSENESLKKDLLKHRKCLQSEVGDDIPLEKVLESVSSTPSLSSSSASASASASTSSSSSSSANTISSTWVGRAQQISLLRDQLRELRNRTQQLESALNDAHNNHPQQSSNNSASAAVSSYLASSNSNSSAAGSGLISSPISVSTSSQFGGGGMGGIGGGNAIDQQHRDEIDRRVNDRQRELERITNELRQTHGELAEVRRKADRAQARAKTLESQYYELKQKSAVLLEKSDNDDQYITELNRTVTELQKRVSALTGGNGGGNGGGNSSSISSSSAFSNAGNPIARRSSNIPNSSSSSSSTSSASNSTRKPTNSTPNLLSSSSSSTTTKTPTGTNHFNNNSNSNSTPEFVDNVFSGLLDQNRDLHERLEVTTKSLGAREGELEHLKSEFPQLYVDGTMPDGILVRSRAMEIQYEQMRSVLAFYQTRIRELETLVSSFGKRSIELIHVLMKDSTTTTSTPTTATTSTASVSGKPSSTSSSTSSSSSSSSSSTLASKKPSTSPIGARKPLSGSSGGGRSTTTTTTSSSSSSTSTPTSLSSNSVAVAVGGGGGGGSDNNPSSVASLEREWISRLSTLSNSLTSRDTELSLYSDLIGDQKRTFDEALRQIASRLRGRLSDRQVNDFLMDSDDQIRNAFASVSIGTLGSAGGNSSAPGNPAAASAVVTPVKSSSSSSNILPPSSPLRDELVNELTRTNAQLRFELAEIKSTYNAMVMQRGNGNSK